MNTADTITTRLHEQADQELHKRIDEAAEPLYNIINDGCSHEIEVVPDGGGFAPVKVRYHKALEALKNLAFNLRCDRNREDKITEFMNRVESLASQLDELRQSIPQ